MVFQKQKSKVDRTRSAVGSFVVSSFNEDELSLEVNDCEAQENLDGHNTENIELLYFAWGPQCRVGDLPGVNCD